MILTAGLVAGTMAFTMGTATPLQPVNLTRVDNNTTRVYAAKDMTIHLSNTDAFEIIIDKGANPIAKGDGKHAYDIKVSKGTTLNIDSQTGWTTKRFNINGNTIAVAGN